MNNSTRLLVSAAIGGLVGVIRALFFDSAAAIWIDVAFGVVVGAIVSFVPPR